MIANQHLKKLPASAIDLLTVIFNSCLKIGYFPKEWRRSKIFSLCKPVKSPFDVCSYRPISLLSSISKLFERIILKLLESFINENSIIITEQYGFRRGKSCIHQLYRITNHIRAQLRKRKSVGMLLLDLQAAFDSVWHPALLGKLLEMNVPMYLIKIIQSFLSERSFTVSVGNCFSSEKLVCAGVPQGAVLSPTLFNLFLNDISIPSDLMLAMFADDTAALATSHNTNAAINKLQKASDSLCRFFKKMRIRVNPSKSEAILFTRKRAVRHQPTRAVKVNDTDVPWGDTTKYLGTMLDKLLTFQTNADYLISKSEKMIKALYPLINRKSKISVDNKLILFKTIFRPTFTYASPIWSNCAKTHLNRIQIHQNKILKIMLGLPRRTPTITLHDDTNLELVQNYVIRMRDRFTLNCQNNMNTDINQLLTP